MRTVSPASRPLDAMYGAATMTASQSAAPPVSAAASTRRRASRARPLQIERPEVFLVARRELLPGERVALTAEMLERVGRCHRAQLGADAQIRGARQPFHEPAPERVADARRIDDALGRHGGHVDAAVAREDRAAALPLGHDQRADVIEHRVLAERRLLA